MSNPSLSNSLGMLGVKLGLESALNRLKNELGRDIHRLKLPRRKSSQNNGLDSQCAPKNLVVQKNMPGSKSGDTANDKICHVAR